MNDVVQEKITDVDTSANREIKVTDWETKSLIVVHVITGPFNLVELESVDEIPTMRKHD